MLSLIVSFFIFVLCKSSSDDESLVQTVLAPRAAAGAANDDDVRQQGSQEGSEDKIVEKTTVEAGLDKAIVDPRDAWMLVPESDDLSGLARADNSLALPVTEAGSEATAPTTAFWPQAGEPSELDVSVCVPLIPRDVKYALIMLESVAAQTVAPKEVIFAMSETSPEDAALFERSMKEVFEHTKVVSTTEKSLAGPNRNRAAAAATGAIVAYFDADDEMHPERIRVIQEMVAAGAMCVVNGYMLDKDRTRKDEFVKLPTVWQSAPKALGSEIYKFQAEATKGFTMLGTWIGKVKRHKCGSLGLWDCKEDTKPSWNPHQGNPACRAEVAKNIPQRDLPRHQDYWFLTDVIKTLGDKDSTLVMVDLPLTLYHPSDHEENAERYSEKKVEKMLENEKGKGDYEEDLAPKHDVSKGALEQEPEADSERWQSFPPDVAPNTLDVAPNIQRAMAER